MHMIVAWDIAVCPERDDIDDALRKCFARWSWVRPLTTFYLIKLKEADDRQNIRASLVDVAKRHPKEVSLLISPAIKGGGYAGWLKRSAWDKIRKRTEES